MKREILFRGKNSDGKWEYGHLVERYGTVVTRGTENKELLECRIFIEYNMFCIVDPETVGQFTGLTDKNGVKIFEGDILKNHEGNTGIVQWFPEHSAFMIFCTNQNKIYFLYDNDFSKIEVIGNVYDNPELLRRKNYGTIYKA